MEDDLQKQNARRPPQKNGRRPQNKNKMEANLRKNKMEDNLKKNGRRPPLNICFQDLARSWQVADFDLTNQKF